MHAGHHGSHKVFSVERAEVMALVGAGAVAYAFVASSSVVPAGVGDNWRDVGVVVGAMVLAAWGGDRVRTVALGIGGAAFATLITRNIISAVRTGP